MSPVLLRKVELHGLDYVLEIRIWTYGRREQEHDGSGIQSELSPAGQPYYLPGVLLEVPHTFRKVSRPLEKSREVKNRLSPLL